MSVLVTLVIIGTLAVAAGLVVGRLSDRTVARLCRTLGWPDDDMRMRREAEAALRRIWTKDGR